MPLLFSRSSTLHQQGILLMHQCDDSPLINILYCSFRCRKCRKGLKSETREGHEDKAASCLHHYIKYYIYLGPLLLQSVIH